MPKTETVTPETPAMDMLKAFKRDPEHISAPKIHYTELDEHTQTALSEENQRMRLFWEAEPGSLDEEQLARRAAIGYFILTGAQLQRTSGVEQEIASSRFTQASLELYGEPDKEEVSKIAATELKYFSGLAGKQGVDQERLQGVIDFYKEQLGNANPEVLADDSESKMAMEIFKSLIEERYKDVLAVLDEVSEREGDIHPEEGKELTEKILDKLAETDPKWKEWSVVLTKDATWSEDRRNKTIGVGRKAKSPRFLKSTVAHEVFVHAQRSVNGGKIDKRFELGLPGFLDSEEGLAVFIANSIRGVGSDRAKDFYMDTAAAAGLLGQPQISRPEMQKIYLDRMIVRTQAAGNEPDFSALEEKAWGYVNRIYRGSVGNEVVGVNTKDISYYHGLVKMTSYIKQKLSEGVDAEKLLDYLMSAPFDPTNPRHVEHMAKHGITL